MFFSAWARRGHVIFGVDFLDVFVLILAPPRHQNPRLAAWRAVHVFFFVVGPGAT